MAIMKKKDDGKKPKASASKGRMPTIQEMKQPSISKNQLANVFNPSSKRNENALVLSKKESSKPFSNNGKYGLGSVAKTVKGQGEMKEMMAPPKKEKSAKPMIKPVGIIKRIVKDVPKKSVKVMKSKLTSTPRVKATIQESRVNSRTGAVKKYPAKEMKMKSISEKEFSESKPKMQKTPWILKQTTGLDSMPSLEGKSKQYRDSVTMETYKKGGYRIK